jgi:molecular chaperone HscB
MYFDVPMLSVWVPVQVNFITLQEEQEISEQYSALVSNAYSVLLQPLARGLYMLHLHGISLEEESTETDPQFLAEIMETNEELAMAQYPDDVRRLENANKSVMDKLTR